MRIIITGAGGFMGRNLCEVLRECHPEDRLDLIDLATTSEALEAAAAEADFVFHLAGTGPGTRTSLCGATAISPWN